MPSPTLILGILLALSVAANGILSKLYVGAKEDVARVQQAFDSFKAQVKVEGEAAQKKADAEIAAHKLAKEQADAENVKTVSTLNASISKLRHDADSARGSWVPAAASSSNRPDVSCFDKSALESALGGFVKDLRGFADEGAAATVDLDTAKRWAQH